MRVLRVLGVQRVLAVLGLTVLRVLVLTVLTVLTELVVPVGAGASDRYALIVTGALGEPSYADQYGRWRQAAVTALLEGMAFDESHIVTLFDGGDADHAATAAGLRHAIERLRAWMKADDVLLVLLIGHGSFDGAEAKFNLVGPDLSAAEWGALLNPLPGRVVFVDSTAASAPFLEAISGPRRIVITATDTPAQRFDTVFAEYFIQALTDPAADIDKNGRVSIWEAFVAASTGVRRHFAQRGQLPTERALLDDNGDRQGREAGSDGADGSVASRTYLDPDVPGAHETNQELLNLLQKRAQLQIEADDLKDRRQLLSAEEYQKEFERIMVELARLAREIRKQHGQLVN